MGKPAFCIGENKSAGVPEPSLITNIKRAVVTNPTIWALRQVKTVSALTGLSLPCVHRSQV